MTLVLLDTNAYLRLAKRVQPLLGVPFGQKQYVLTILDDVEKEVHQSPRLRFNYPWFDHDPLAKERLSRRFRFNKIEKQQMQAATSILRAHVMENATAYTSHGRSPPSTTDCSCIAFGQVREAIVVTDDLGMHQLADDFDIAIWHGHELLKKMLSAKLINHDLVREIYGALELNNDLTRTWREVKYTTFKKIFGSKP